MMMGAGRTPPAGAQLDCVPRGRHANMGRRKFLARSDEGGIALFARALDPATLLLSGTHSMIDGEKSTFPGYKAQIRADIEACVSRMGCQPILFIGSGLSKRYFSGPSWDELLHALAEGCPLIDKSYA